MEDMLLYSTRFDVVIKAGYHEIHLTALNASELTRLLSLLPKMKMVDTYNHESAPTTLEKVSIHKEEEADAESERINADF